MTGPGRLYRLLRGDNSEVRQAAGDFQERYDAMTAAEQAELRQLIAEIEPEPDGRRALSVNDLPALVEEAKRRAGGPGPGLAAQPPGAPGPRAGRWRTAYQPGPPRSGRWSVLAVFGAVLVVVGFALAVGSVLWSQTGQRVLATNQSCTPDPPRCVVSWEQGGEHHTDQIGPTTDKHEPHNLTPGARNALRVRDGHVVTMQWPVTAAGAVLFLAGTTVYRAGRRRRR